MLDIDHLIANAKVDPKWPDYIEATTSDPDFFASHVLSPDDIMTLTVDGKRERVRTASAGVGLDDIATVTFRRIDPPRPPLSDL